MTAKDCIFLSSRSEQLRVRLYDRAVWILTHAAPHSWLGRTTHSELQPILLCQHFREAISAVICAWLWLGCCVLCEAGSVAPQEGYVGRLPRCVVVKVQTSRWVQQCWGGRIMHIQVRYNHGNGRVGQVTGAVTTSILLPADHTTRCTLPWTRAALC